MNGRWHHASSDSVQATVEYRQRWFCISRHLHAHYTGVMVSQVTMHILAMWWLSRAFQGNFSSFLFLSWLKMCFEFFGHFLRFKRIKCVVSYVCLRYSSISLLGYRSTVMVIWANNSTKYTPIMFCTLESSLTSVISILNVLCVSVKTMDCYNYRLLVIASVYATHKHHLYQCEDGTVLNMFFIGMMCLLSLKGLVNIALIYHSSRVCYFLRHPVI